MKKVTVVEMQSRLPEILARRDADLAQVTFKGNPVVAVLPLERYQTLRFMVSAQMGIGAEVTRESLGSGQLLFHSYAKRLAPRLQGHEGLVKIIEVTRRDILVGAIVAWNDWQRVGGSLPDDEQLQPREDHTLTVVGARNHLLKLAEQFGREEKQGIFAPVRVTRLGEPVMAIVSWGWFERVTIILKTQMMPFTHMEPDGTMVLSSNETIEHPSDSQAERLHTDQFDLFNLCVTQWSQLHQTTSQMAVTMVHMTHSADPSALLAWEEQCAMVVRQGQELVSLVARLRSLQEKEGLE